MYLEPTSAFAADFLAVSNRLDATAEAGLLRVGENVDGYVVPMFHNQIAIAYHPSKVANPPKTFDALAAWVKATPGRFGYNGIKGGVSGVGFTLGWVYRKTGLYQHARACRPRISRATRARCRSRRTTT